jgi:hypothetical protein
MKSVLVNVAVRKSWSNKTRLPQNLLCISTSQGGGDLRERLEFPDEDGEIVAKGEI